MVLYKLEDFEPNYRDSFDGHDIKGLGVYTQGTDEKIGSVNDVLVDEDGHIRYLVVDLGFWIFGKKVLLPIGRTRIDYNSDRIYTIGLTREQAEDLPEFNERLALDYDYEERVRGVYRSPGNYTTPAEASRPVEASAPLDSTYSTPSYNRDSYTYENEPSLYNLNEQDHQTLRLYEERLIAGKQRRKTGEVAIGKHVETETARVAVPVEKERVVIERVTPADAGRAVPASEANFREGEVARVELHEETPEIRKEAVLREEVRVRKVVDQETVEAQETVRREELDVNAPNLPIEER
ncbi:PRC-barrel domain-containing protein AvaK [Nostoc linckia NIES-25]|nr:PRC-barrel domain-containing protein AvaK [Nostoc linckia NIES-25]